MLECSKVSESVLPEVKNNLEVMQAFLFGDHFQLKSPNVDRYRGQVKINESKLRGDFNEFFRRMRLKWCFWDEPQNFNETLASIFKWT